MEPYALTPAIALHQLDILVVPAVRRAQRAGIPGPPDPTVTGVAQEGIAVADSAAAAV
ncbi:hypothetical protein ACBQ16_02100 [Halopseudomonas bauzanensis]|uniref:hypothetical protein n=1 Tax=Halopseudomonas bauzanensis TaxID=653930 RepID=UPI002557B681|nr:hypothetical protein [Halopseudomonas bauzanensis]